MPFKKNRRIKKRKNNATKNSRQIVKYQASDVQCSCYYNGKSSPTTSLRPIASRSYKSSPATQYRGTITKFYPQYQNIFKYTRSLDIKNMKMSCKSVYKSTGLTSKEKSYVICTCQAKTNRYSDLKATACRAIKNNKIFSIYGSCNAVRKALVERGWVEKIPLNKMNLSKIRNGTISDKSDVHTELERILLSNLVEKQIPNFIWRSSDEPYDTTINMNSDVGTIVNKLKLDAMWTTKQGLCISLKSNNWFNIEDVAEVNTPRTYNTYDPGDIEAFANDYKITACTNLLKWVLSMVANNRPVFVESGKISLNVIVFALNRCKDYLFRKNNKDIDTPITNVNSGLWNAFLKKYYRIIAKEAFFQLDHENKLPLYLRYANFLLNEIHKYRPQLSCEGCHDIWIIKPGHCSRGRGIRLASKLGVILNLLNKANSKYVIQKYIEEPLLIHDTKFDIRQYYLVTSTYPYIIWMYQECYLKFSSQKYNLNNYHESIHLTNNAVQKNYINCKGRHPDLPDYNMWDLDTYKDYLRRIGKEKVWENIIYPGMKKSIINIMLSCQDSLSVSKNRFELYGCDFILDKDYKPWLIEINSCPDLHSTTQVTAKICPAVISDIIKVVIDNANNPKCSTGKFECIYRQPITIPKYAADIRVRGFALPLNYFYKGKIELNEPLHFNDAEERDITDVYKSIEKAYQNDVMVEPEDNDYVDNTVTRQDCCAHSTISENELDSTATVITEQIDDLFNKITSNNNSSSRKKYFTQTLKSAEKPSESDYSKVNRKVDRGGIFVKNHQSLSPTSPKTYYNNSYANISHLVNFNKALLTLGKKFSKKESPSNISPSTQQIFTNETVVAATNKLYAFLDKKEKEYLDS